MNKIISEKPWLRSVHYVADRQAEEDDMNHAARDVCEYLIERMGLR